MANHSRWADIRAKRLPVPAGTRSVLEQDFSLAKKIFDVRTDVGLSQRALAERMGTTQSVISRLEESGGSGNRVDTLAGVATALGRHLVISFPITVSVKLKDAVQVA